MTENTNLMYLRKVNQRNDKFPGSADRVFGRGKKTKTGFAQIPRTVPLIATLLDNLTKKINPGRVYVDLWFKSFEDYMLTITDEPGMAFSSGFSNESRAVRSWRERIDGIKNLGFIEIQPGATTHRYILLLDPDLVVQTKKDEFRRVNSKFFDRWWSQYCDTYSSFGLGVDKPLDTEK
jgi:hypothetical protein